MENNDSLKPQIDPTLKSVLSQLSRESGLSYTLIHPGIMAADEIEDAFDGLDTHQVATLREGLPSISTESNRTIAEIEHQIIRSVLSVLDPAKKAWAAFFEPDGNHQFACPRTSSGAE